MKALLLTYGLTISAIAFSQEDRIKALHLAIEKVGFNLPQKISLCHQILTIDSTDYVALLEQGQAYYSRWGILGRVDEVYLDSALIQLNKACGSMNADYKAFGARANFYYDFKEFDKAFSDFTKAIELNPDVLAYRRLRASIYVRKKEFEKALADINFVLDREEATCWMLRMRATCYANLTQFDRCKSDLINALSIDDKDNDNHLFLGDYYAMIGNYKKAIKRYSFIIDRIDAYSLAYLKRGNAYALLGQVDHAKSDWQVAKSRGYIVDDNAKEIRFGASGYRLTNNIE